MLFHIIHLHIDVIVVKVRRILRYQREVIRIRISKKKTTQWPKEKVQNDKQDQQNIHIKLKIE
jgi:hypothetical protein